MNEQTEQFELKESVIVEGITEDYVWYHSRRLLTQMQTWQNEFERIVNVMENRHKEHLKMIGDLLDEIKKLKEEK